MNLPVLPCIGGVLDRLGLHRGVHDDLVQTEFRDGSRGHACGDGGLQQPLHAFLADALTPAGHLAGIDGQCVLEELLTAKVLPVRVLDPTVDRLFIRQTFEMFEVVQTCHQSDGHGGPPVVGAIQRAEFLCQAIPGNHPGQADHFVVHVQSQLKTHGGDQRLLVGPGLRFWLHRYTGFWGFIPTLLVYGIGDRFPLNLTTIGFLWLFRTN